MEYISRHLFSTAAFMLLCSLFHSVFGIWKWPKTIENTFWNMQYELSLYFNLTALIYHSHSFVLVLYKSANEPKRIQKLPIPINTLQETKEMWPLNVMPKHSAKYNLYSNQLVYTWRVVRWQFVLKRQGIKEIKTAHLKRPPANSVRIIINMLYLTFCDATFYNEEWESIRFEESMSTSDPNYCSLWWHAAFTFPAHGKNIWA